VRLGESVDSQKPQFTQYYRKIYQKCDGPLVIRISIGPLLKIKIFKYVVETESEEEFSSSQFGYVFAYVAQPAVLWENRDHSWIKLIEKV